MTERIIRGRPTLRARLHHRLGGAICRRRGHQPTLTERHYLVATGSPQRIGEGSLRGTTDRVPLFGTPTEERSGRRVTCRRCWQSCGDTLLEETA